MKLINKQGDFAPAPMGLHKGVLVDVVDLGHLPTANGPRHKLNMCFELGDALMEDGRPFTVYRRFTASLAETAHLAQFIAKWRGGVPIRQGEEIDLDSLIGKSALLVITHAQSTKGDGKVYANIDSILPCAEQLRPSGHYKRKEQSKQSGSAVPTPAPHPVQSSPVTPATDRTAFQSATPASPLPTTEEMAPKPATEAHKAKFLTVLKPIWENAGKYFFSLGAIGRTQPLEEIDLKWVPATKVQFDNVMASIASFIDSNKSVTDEEDQNSVPF